MVACLLACLFVYFFFHILVFPPYRPILYALHIIFPDQSDTANFLIKMTHHDTNTHITYFSVLVAKLCRRINPWGVALFRSVCSYQVLDSPLTASGPRTSVIVGCPPKDPKLKKTAKNDNKVSPQAPIPFYIWVAPLPDPEFPEPPRLPSKLGLGVPNGHPQGIQ